MYVLTTRDSFETQSHQQIESEFVEKYLSCKEMSKENCSRYTHIGQNKILFLYCFISLEPG